MKKYISIISIFIISIALLAVAKLAFANSIVGVPLQTDGYLSVGTTTTNAKANIFSTGEQMRLGYDSSNYNSFTVDGLGNFTLAPSNGGIWKIISDPTSPIYIAGSSSNSITGASISGSAILSGGNATSPNIITNNTFSVIGGGLGNQINWTGAGNGIGNFIGGGSGNILEKQPQYSSIVGGLNNKITSSTNSGPYADFIGGGESNLIDSNSGNHNFIGGGKGNQDLGNGYAAIVGGLNNTAWTFSFVGGGSGNTAGSATTDHAAVGGGQGNSATGNYSMIIGGLNNVAAGQYSFASGTRAKALYDGDFVWADSNNFDFPSTTANEFDIRATGGMRFVTAINGSGTPTETFTIDTSGDFTIPGGLQLSTTVGQPTCSASTDGMSWYTQFGSGVKDAYQVCAKDAGNNYAWRSIY